MPDLNMQLSKNFKLFEFTTSPTADRLGLSNVPNDNEIANLKRLCEKILQPARDALGPLRINSGFRSAKLNAAVGGVATSDHRLGFAADIVPLDVTTRELAEWVVANCKEFDQVILEFGTKENPNWIHLSAEPRNRKQVLWATKSGKKTVYHPIVLAAHKAPPAATAVSAAPSFRLGVAKTILDWEARRDASGRIAVYLLPAGDGGGRYEVGGINEKYNPAKAAELKALVEAGKFDEAERAAIEFIASDTDKVVGWSRIPAVEAYLRDCCFNRGKTGAARIYQLALRVGVDGDVGDETMTAATAAETNPEILLQNLRAARERYERVWVKRDESSKFWKGLVNRWNKALKYATSLLEKPAVPLTKAFKGEIKVWSTAEWGARSPRRLNFEQNAAKGIVIHHTTHPNRAPLTGEDEKQMAFRIARNIQTDHLNRRDTPTSAPWSDTGQNFLISRGGVIMEGRHGSLAAAAEGRVVRGAHANSATHNKTWYGIELEGNYYGAYDMTPQQWEALVELCAWLTVESGWDSASIKGHQEVTDSSTACPGKLMEHLGELRAESAARAAEIRLRQ